MISTRGNGRARATTEMSIYGYNHVVMLWIKQNGEVIPLDASDESLPQSLLPLACQGRYGWAYSRPPGDFVLIGEHVKFLRLESDAKNLLIHKGEFFLDEEGQIRGTLKREFSDYAAQNRIEERAQDSDVENPTFFEAAQVPWKATEYSYQDEFLTKRRVYDTWEISSDMVAENQGDLLYLPMLLSFGQDENPLKPDVDRQFPVDFGVPLSTRHTFILHFPNGYQLEEPIQNQLITLDNDGGTYRQFVSQQEDKLIISATMNLKRGIYSPEEYAPLSEFFTRIIELQAELFVLVRQP